MVPGDRRSAVGRRSLLRAVGAGTAGVTSLAGCSKREGALRREASVEGGTPDGGVFEVIDVAGTRSREDYEKALERVSDEHRIDLTLKYREVSYDSLQQYLWSRIEKGNPPDVAAIDQVWLGDFIDRGVLQPLDDVATDIRFDDFLDPFASAVTASDHVWAIPITTDVRGMYWQKRAFHKAGLDPENPPATWTELIDVAKTLHDPPHQYGAVYPTVPGRWAVSLFETGGRFLSASGDPAFHEEPGVRAAGFLDQLYNQAAVGPPDPVTNVGSTLASDFFDGKYAILLVEGSWLNYFWKNRGGTDHGMYEHIGFAPTPGPNVATMSGGFTWATFEGAGGSGLARDFLRIVGSRAFQRQLALKSARVPTRKSLLDDPQIWDVIVYGDTVKRLLQRTRTRPIRHWQAVASSLEPALREVAAGKSEPAAALERAAEQFRAERRENS